MKISRDEVRRIAALACLEFDAEREATMADEMSRILDYVDQIRDAPVDPGATGAADAPLRLREDVPSDSLAPGAVAGQAPRFSQGHFVVPKVIGGE
jgi:aspartyl-tRNA(Asn)/glutamyl-tRNA(Gln) amidotransferase subunit C